MAQGEGFNHITVTAADEDDVVIVAGVAQAEEPEAEPEPEPAEPAGAPEGNPAEPAGARNSLPDDPAGTQTPAPAPQNTSTSGGGYRETTLEDLERKPMPFAQKTTIIAAIALIAVAVIYYFVAMA